MNAPAQSSPEFEEVSAIWRRNPVAGSWENGMYVFTLHGKKLSERFAAGGYKSMDDLKFAIRSHIDTIVGKMTYWKYGPVKPRAEFTLVKKDDVKAREEVVISPAAVVHVAAYVTAAANAAVRAASAESTAEKSAAETIAVAASLQAAASAIAAMPALPAYPDTAVPSNKIAQKTSFIFNIVAESTADKFTQRLLAILPGSEDDFEIMMNTILTSHISDDESFHTMYARMIMAMDAKHLSRPYPDRPSDMLYKCILKYLENEPRAVKETNASEIARRGKQASAILFFTGLMYRYNMLTLKQVKDVISYCKKRMDSAKDSETYEFFFTAVILVLVRAGRMMLALGGESSKYLVSATDDIKDSLKSSMIKTSRPKLYFMDFIDVMKKEFHIGKIQAWMPGAPAQNMAATPKRLRSATRKAGNVVRNKTRKQNSFNNVDVQAIIKRYPVNYKITDNGAIITEFHNKKTADRYETEKRRYPSVELMKKGMLEQLHKIFEESKYWKEVPAGRDGLIKVVKK